MGFFGLTKTRGRILWGKYVVPQELANYHFFAAGSTGSGKSTLLRMLYRGVLPDVLNKTFDTRALFYDAKVEAYPDLASLGLQHETVILNPFDARCSAWDMARDIHSEAQAGEIAAIIVPPGEGNNKYFYDAARLMLTTAIQSLIRVKGTKWTFRDLLLACANVHDLKHLAEQARLSGVIAINEFINKSREARSVHMTLTVENSAYYTIAAGWELARKEGRTFSIQDWVAGMGPQILLIGASKQTRTALATLNRLIVQRAQQVLLDYREKDDRTGRRTWAILDEFATLGGIPNIEELLTEGRSRGVCVVLGFQHISHIIKCYNLLASALLGQCTHQAYFRAADHEMAKWCALNFGRLITMDDDGHIKKDTPAATENDFGDLEPGSSKTGFRCIIRSSKKVLPAGPMRIHVGPRKDLARVDAWAKDSLAAEDPMRARFLNWKKDLRLEPWSPSERIALGLPASPAQDAPEVPLPVNALPVLFPLLDVPF